MSNNTTYGDHITLMAAAKLYDVQFVIVSSLGHQATRFISSASTTNGDDVVQYDRPILFLGHYAETDVRLTNHHYVSLHWQNAGTGSLSEYMKTVVHSQDTHLQQSTSMAESQLPSECLHTCIHTAETNKVRIMNFLCHIKLQMCVL